MAWDRACPCTRCRPGHAAAGSTRRSSTTPRCCASSSNASAWPNPTSRPGAAVCGDRHPCSISARASPPFPGQPCRRRGAGARARRARRRHAHRAGPTAARPPAARPATLARPALRCTRMRRRAHALTLRLDNPGAAGAVLHATIGCTWSADHGAIPSRPASAWTASGIRQRTAAATTCGCSAPTASIATSPDARRRAGSAGHPGQL